MSRTRTLLPGRNSRAPGRRRRLGRAAALLTLALAFGPGLRPAMAEEYLLGPQDRVRLKVYEWRASRDTIFEWTALNDQFTVGADGSLVNVANVKDSDNGAFLLNDIRELAIAEVGGTTYLFAGGDEDGITVFSVAADGTLNLIESVADSENPDYELTNINGLATAVVDGITYLFAVSAADGGISVSRLSSARS